MLIVPGNSQVTQMLLVIEGNDEMKMVVNAIVDKMGRMEDLKN